MLVFFAAYFPWGILTAAYGAGFLVVAGVAILIASRRKPLSRDRATSARLLLMHLGVALAATLLGTMLLTGSLALFRLIYMTATDSPGNVEWIPLGGLTSLWPVAVAYVITAFGFALLRRSGSESVS